MTSKSLLAEMHQVQLAIDLIELGARLQVLETETDLSRARLIRLFKEIRGMSPPKGMLPFSTDWFITWMPNIHSSLFYNIFLRLQEDQDCERMEAFIKAYRLYAEQVEIDGAETVLGLTRAWTLVRFFESDLLQLSECTRCAGHFVAHAHSPTHDYVCGICQPPSRAGKTRKRQQSLAEQNATSASSAALGHRRA
ncbi:flagellar transcriptional regulator FlhC [Halomonas saccharevitans]|uniref:Flagellar transcriptional regulator FlhC n=1 Tax=Halomonas saccharevitans TaxID=416872 RepID=A0ABU3NG22_9GAMM|nr:flagellar transcriptional regulator FlhC [Halomonas saccharevitans]MDT8879172.1 flagellar transcriptional regulator FlhC [Halomonas saccharevitans]